MAGVDASIYFFSVVRFVFLCVLCVLHFKPASNQTYVCPEGRYGPGCGKQCPEICDGSCSQDTGDCIVNIAVGKNYRTSSTTFPNGPPSWAADGYPGSCIYTRRDGNVQWWEVDLGAEYPVYAFTVWGLAGYIMYLIPFEITVDGNLCARHETGTAISQTVLCTNVTNGRIVRLTRTRIDGYELILCELQIFVCSEGWYGPGCGKRCQVNCNGSCSQDTGDCIECKKGLYGSNCSLPCQHPQCEQCDRQTGECTACRSNLQPPACTDCKRGYTGSTCTLECSLVLPGCSECARNSSHCTACLPGYYGNTCQPCSNISSNCVDCTQDGGRCTGCKSGYYGSDCQRACSEKFNNCLECTQDGARCTKCTPGYSGTACDYNCATIGDGCLTCGNGICLSCTTGYRGVNCELPCSSLSPGCAECNRYENSCTACITGFLPPFCSECKKGLYGSDCSLSCQHPQCQQCDRQTGECTACLSNLQPPACTECRDGFYEFRSYSRCIPCIGQCYNNTPCDKTTGNCAKCPPGRTGNTCSDECPQDKYGQDCEEVCGNCRYGPCNVTTGECPQCNIGYQPPFCKQECDDGHYGYNCDMKCGRCKGSAACNKTDGRCTQYLCEPGWYPPNCMTVIQDGLPVAAVTSLSIVVTVIVCAVIILGIFWYRKRARQTIHKTCRSEADREATKLRNPTEDVSFRGGDETE